MVLAMQDTSTQVDLYHPGKLDKKVKLSRFLAKFCVVDRVYDISLFKGLALAI